MLPTVNFLLLSIFQFLVFPPTFVFKVFRATMYFYLREIILPSVFPESIFNVSILYFPQEYFPYCFFILSRLFPPTNYIFTKDNVSIPSVNPLLLPEAYLSLLIFSVFSLSYFPSIFPLNKVAPLKNSHQYSLERPFLTHFTMFFQRINSYSDCYPLQFMKHSRWIFYLLLSSILLLSHYFFFSVSLLYWKFSILSTNAYCCLQVSCYTKHYPSREFSIIENVFYSDSIITIPIISIWYMWLSWCCFSIQGTFYHTVPSLKLSLPRFLPNIFPEKYFPCEDFSVFYSNNFPFRLFSH